MLTMRQILLFYYWACPGSLQSNQWCQEQTPPRSSQHCLQSPAQLQPAQKHCQCRHPHSVYSWLHFTKPSRLLPDTSAQPWHFWSLQIFKRFLFFHQQWTVPSLECELKAKTTSYFITWQTIFHVLQEVITVWDNHNQVSKKYLWKTNVSIYN